LFTRFIALADLSSKTCPDRPVQVDLSCYPVPVSSPGCPARCLVPIFLSQLSCHCCHVLSWLTCPGCPISGALFQLSFFVLSCLAVLSWLYYHEYPATIVLRRLSCPSCPVHADMFWPQSTLSCPGCPVLSRLSSPVFLSRLSSPLFSPAFLSQLSSPTFLSQLSCPICPFRQ
jgi:hypothetical protein